MQAAVVPAVRARWKIDGREYRYEALDYVAKGKVKVIAETYPLKDVNRAYDRVAEGKVRFRAVITDA
jgi:D-arabinose 1-dehydrogenase-like Zn-dependent alcohol dehydrogenase